MNTKPFCKLLLSLCLITYTYAIDEGPSYAIAQGQKDEERLTILNELHNPSSLAVLNITPGMRILTIGCGIGLLELELAKATGPAGFVLATDISSEQLVIAEKNSRDAHLSNLQFLETDAASTIQVEGLFDRIHCRFVLSHLPWQQVIQIVPLLYSKLAPEGLLVLEEIAAIDSLYCAPIPHPGYDMWKAAVQKQFFFQKSDPSPGKRLYQYLVEEKYSVSYSSHQPVLSNKREKSILSLGMRSVSDKFLKAQLMSVQEIETTVALLQELEQNPNIFPRYNEVSQITIQRPYRKE